MPTKASRPPGYYAPYESRRNFCAAITTIIIVVVLIVLILWLVYRPSKPQFMVVGAASYGVNFSGPPLISATMQFTVLIKNPNRRVSIYYDKLSAFVSYKNQPITQELALPPLYLEKHSAVSVSPVIGGSLVPVSSEVTNGLESDENYGVVGLRLVMLGRLRWKTGIATTGHYSFYVKCDLMLGLKKGLVGQVPLLGAPPCNVDI